MDTPRLLSPGDRIILPLDFASGEEAVRMARRLERSVGLFKVGLTLFVKEGPAIVNRLYDTVGDRLFLDLKFHDIPETVKGASNALRDACPGIRFVTVHAAGGETMLRAAVEVLGKKSVVLGVTVLTSTGGPGGSVGDPDPVERRVLEYAETVKKAGAGGVVCSGHESAAIKRNLGGGFLAVVPGIRPNWADVKTDDQRRTMTPGEAVLNGADYLVVGRPILRAPDPVKAAERISGEIEEALNRGEK